MQKIKAKEQKPFDDLQARWDAKLNELEAAQEALGDIVNELNEMREEFVGLAEDIVSQMEEYYDERSEKWQESEKGLAFSEWKEKWDNIVAEAADEIAVPEDLDIPDLFGELEWDFEF